MFLQSPSLDLLFSFYVDFGLLTNPMGAIMAPKIGPKLFKCLTTLSLAAASRSHFGTPFRPLSIAVQFWHHAMAFCSVLFRKRLVLGLTRFGYLLPSVRGWMLVPLLLLAI